MSHAVHAAQSIRQLPSTRLARRGGPRVRTALPSWPELALAAPCSVQRVEPQAARLKSSATGLLALVIGVHVAVVLLAQRLPEKQREITRASPLAMEFVKAPEPPKIDPPKPEPPKPQKRALVPPIPTVPPIETAPPEPQIADAAPAGEVVAEPVAGPPPVEPELPITPAEGRAGYLNNPAPAYPSVALRHGWEGTVLLRVRVLATGRVESVEVRKSSGRKLLDEEAVRAVRGWLFSPSKRGDVAVDGWAAVPIEFRVDA